ncbi:MAG: tetratricopeptide repeat protein [Acidobacteria bacterium]|nr:tetratricopeptide repeat protein [Acidobacteriota bacterium]
MHFSIRKFFLPAALVMGLLVLSVLPGMAQTRIIKGKVTDDKSQPVAGAQILIQGMDIVREFKVKTDKKGQYFYLLGMQSGTFRVVVRAQGFRPEYREGIRPQLSEETAVDFQLTPGSDYKLPFEMSDEEKAEYMKKYEEQKKRQQLSGEIQATFKNAVSLSEAGRYDEAIAEFNKALEKMPDEAVIHAGIANALAKQGKNEEALASYQKAVSLNPDDPSIHSAMGVLLSTMGKVAESQEAFKKASSLDPGSAAQNFYNIGVTMVNSGKSAEAAEAFKQAIAADPNHAESYYQLGMALSGKQDTIPAAIDALKKYIEIGKKPEQVEVAKQIIQALSGK